MTVWEVTDTMLFYGGIILAVVVLVLFVVSMCCLRMRAKWLNKCLDREYGRKIN